MTMKNGNFGIAFSVVFATDILAQLSMHLTYSHVSKHRQLRNVSLSLSVILTPGEGWLMTMSNSNQ